MTINVAEDEIQGASGIDARFLKLSPALTVSPIMTKFSQYNPHSTCHCQNYPRRMSEDGE